VLVYHVYYVSIDNILIWMCEIHHIEDTVANDYLWMLFV
jgi:hypothetical protein